MNNSLNTVFTIASLILGIFGALYTYKAYSREHILKLMSWSDIQNGIKYIWKNLRKINFSPDILISPDPKGGIIAHMLSQFYDTSLFIEIGHAELKSRINSEAFFKENCIVIETTRWEVLFSKWLENMPKREDLKIIIVEDFILSGDFNVHLLKYLSELGYKKENIKICSLVVTKVAISSSKAPDISWKVVDSEDFYFPWGKAE